MANPTSPPEHGSNVRNVYCKNREQMAHQRFSSNQVITSRYSLVTFLPKNLLEQFRKVSNIYFLVLAALQIIPSISITNGVPTIAIPLVFVLTVTAFKDALEDIRRHKSDNEENNRKVQIVKRELHSGSGLGEDGVLQTVAWKDVHVGDLIVCRNRQVFAADMVILASSDHNGLAYIETANLDGETNLKLRQALTATQSKFNAIENAPSWDVHVACELPNKHLETFDAALNIKPFASSSKEESYSLSPKQILLRGCKLRNTDWIIGLVVYTGPESKIQMNSNRTPSKESTLERMTNKMTIIVFSLQLLLCFIAGVAGGALENTSTVKDAWYLGLSESNAALNGFLRFFTFIIIFGNFIPISLIVTMGVVKSIQARFINWDEDMYHDKTDTYAQVRTSSLNEELGQVEYIFSDKTGTLTCNVMEFRKCSIGGVSYGQGLTEIRRGVLKKQGKPIPPEPVPPANAPKTPNVNFFDPSMLEHMNDPNHPQSRKIKEFFMHLAINHSIMPEHNSAGELIYSASSPDEGALVYAAKHFGFQFLSRDPNSIDLIVQGVKQHIEILHTLEFNSDRKRSSVICRMPGESGGDRIVLYCKGADSVIEPLLKPNQSIKPATYNDMNLYSEDGLRTLAIAFAELPRARYEAWAHEYKQATLALKDRQLMMDTAAANIEKDLELLGATAIEDKLQPMVSDTIASLAEAGIKIWMLTGDKIETAINIGFATSLLDNDQKLIKISFDDYNSKAAVAQVIKDSVKERAISNTGKPLGLVIDGRALTFALEAELALDFIALATQCKSVICCRVSPEQKGSVVRLVKKELQKVTLAIGDGANDCNMIQAAHVGVGLRGEEGLQAFNSSDYGISQFRFLKKLLLVHGRWTYRRMSKLVCYMFYKNIVVCLPQYWLAMESLFSGQKLYFDYIYQLYNIVFTALPVVVCGVFDQDINADLSLKFPALYRLGPQNYYFNRNTFVQWVFNGIWHSVICYGVTMLSFGGSRITMSNGQANDLNLIGSVIFLLVIIIVNIKICMETYYYWWFVSVSVFLSVMCWFLAMFIFADLPSLSSDMVGIIYRLFKDPSFYFVCILGVVAAFTRDFAWKAYVRAFRPQQYHIVQELQYLQAQGNDVVLAKVESEMTTVNNNLSLQ